MGKVTCYVAGKSGGHIIPALVHIQRSLTDDLGTSVLFFSTDGALDCSIIAQSGSVNRHVALHLPSVPHKKRRDYPLFLWRLGSAFLRSFKILYSVRPEKVISMGGYISLPVCYAAWILGVPIELYELNVIPGKAVKVLSRYARTVYTCFKETAAHLSVNCVLIDYPLRSFNVINRHEACEVLAISGDQKVLLILGGSQGSEFINGLAGEFCKWYVTYRNVKLHVIHQTGERNLELVKCMYDVNGISATVFSYKPDIGSCYSAADAVIARAGAGTLFELLFFKKHSFVIPLEAGITVHQRENAYAMSREYPDVFTTMLQQEIMQDKERAFQLLASLLNPQKTTSGF
jgi:UDP-N-acetylglucosamine--N-acetylmuramyl-(pentapeptide) pyrophosphoryl-undecaprenol N-acetylglucosamine transferase